MSNRIVGGPPFPLGKIIVVLVVLLMLIGCSDDGDERQFAGDQPDVTTTATVEVTESPVIADETPAQIASPLSGDDLLIPRGDAAGATIVVDGDVMYFDVEDQTIQTMWSSDEFDAWVANLSPDGDSIAVLIAPTSSVTAWEVLVLDLTGNEIGHTLLMSGSASPAAGGDVVASGSGAISWSSATDEIAVALPTGGIFRVSPNGSVDVMSSPAHTPYPGGVAWSPTGGAIAFSAAPSRSQGKGLFVSPTSALPLDPVNLVRPDSSGNRSIEAVDWPEGPRIFQLVERFETGSGKGDIMSIDAAGGAPQLEWSSGVSGPGDGAQSFSISPDGQVLAIVVGTHRQHSKLVLRQPGGSVEHVFRLPAEMHSASIAWTGSGVAVFGVSADEGAPVAMTISQMGETSLVTEIEGEAPPDVASPEASPEAVPEASPEATPVASPPASPLASPPASPAASPFASPVASPMASPFASPGPAGSPQTDD